jgi:hypothetical protein
MPKTETARNTPHQVSNIAPGIDAEIDALELFCGRPLTQAERADLAHILGPDSPRTQEDILL